jgi:CheY-like chemotaxis protein
MASEKIKILVVDDEPDVVDTLKNSLSVRGYEILNAYSGEQALAILETEKVDLVLLDIIMHGISGIAVAKVIKERYPHVKIIVITAHPEAGERMLRDTLLEGLIIKPCVLESLYDKLLELQAN